MGVLAVIAKRLDALIGYASLRAIESPSTLDDQQWLTLPFWAYMKLLFCMWLVLPMFHGAAYIYEKHIRRYVKIGGYVSPSSNYTADQRKVLQMMSLDARKSVSQYVEKHGWEAVERAIKAAEKETKKR
ncbi:hypothetical protein CISIN_1g033043mg [Citrus sinensis]|uniref:HVA22-like protein n=1 Tax=Citrus sinensis TaxID=2711 RepID=A0A067F0I9_CITSI|nr:hypothetical protein CISIN_1g033043mg [Citrus sinensis]